VQSASSENIFGLAISIGGGFVGVAGGIDVNLLHVTDKSFIAANSQINTLGGADASQSVNVSAVDLAKTLTIGGGGGGGFVGAGAGYRYRHPASDRPGVSSRGLERACSQ